MKNLLTCLFVLMCISLTSCVCESIDIVEKNESFYIQLTCGEYSREILIENLEKTGTHSFDVLGHSGNIFRGNIKFRMLRTQSDNVCGKFTFFSVNYSISPKANYVGLWTYYDCSRDAYNKLEMIVKDLGTEFLVLLYEQHVANPSIGIINLVLYNELDGIRVYEIFEIDYEIENVSHTKTDHMLDLFVTKINGNTKKYTFYY